MAASVFEAFLLPEFLRLRLRQSNLIDTIDSSGQRSDAYLY